MLLYPMVIASLLAATSASYEPAKEVLAQFQESTFRYTGGRYKDDQFRYRLHVPTKLKQGERYPLILWLHGGRERGNDNRAQLRWLDYVLAKLPPDQVDYFVLAVQVPSDVRYWTDENEADDMLSVAKSILDKTISSNPVDVSRIYLAGVSSGGTGCWEMALRYPDVFAAVAPMGSQGGDLTKINRITELPVWAFHSQADHPQRVQRTVDELRSAGGKAYLTIIESDPDDLSDWMHRHDCWSDAIRKYGNMNWLFQQRRGSPVIPPPGHESWSWLHYSAFALAVLGVCGGGWFLTSRARSLWI